MDKETVAGAALNVLVVDDDMLIQMAMTDILSELGHESVTAASAEEAIAMVEAGGTVDLVITDHAMPGMTGLELARRLRTTHPQLPVFLASGFDHLPDENQSDDWPRLRKPFRVEELKLLVERVKRS